MKIKPGSTFKVEIEIPPESAAALEKEFPGFRRTLAWFKVLAIEALETLLLRSLGHQTIVLKAVEETARRLELDDREPPRSPEIVEFKMLLEPHKPDLDISGAGFPCCQCVLASEGCCLEKSLCQFDSTGKTWRKHLPQN